MACTTSRWAPPRTTAWPPTRAPRSCASARRCTRARRLPGCRELLQDPEPPPDMGFSDTWHRTLVYFGLAEDREAYEDYEEPDAREPEAELESRYRERPNVRRLQSRRRRDEIDDIFADDSPSERRTAVLRSVGSGAGSVAAGRGNGRDVRVHLVIPKSFNDAQDVADKFKDAIPVILNLQGSDTDLSKRLIDFAS